MSAGRRANVLVDLLQDLPQGPGMPSHDDMLCMLRQALHHRSDTVRADALALVCTHPRSTALPAAAELELAKEALTLSLRCNSASDRQKFLPTFTRLFARIRTGAGAVLTRPKAFPPHAMEDVRRCEAWLQGITAQLVASIYPGAVYGREYMAVELLRGLLELFDDQLALEVDPGHVGSKCRKTSSSSGRTNGPSSALRKIDMEVGSGLLVPGAFRPFFPEFLSPDTVDLLLTAVGDPWDKIRESASEALLLLPAPLPGLSSPEAVQALVQRALQLLRSPRMKDADGGARLVVIVFQQYVLRLGWQVALKSGSTGDIEVQVQLPRAGSDESSEAPALAFLDNLLGLVDANIAAGEADLLGASQRSLAHGPLLALRYAQQFSLRLASHPALDCMLSKHTLTIS